MTAKQILPEITKMNGTVQFFPADPLALANIASQAAKFIEDHDKLLWLVSIFVDHIGEWKGIKEFRAVYCTRYRPVDGIEEYSTFRGFSPDDIEGEHIEASKRFKHLEKGSGDTTLPPELRSTAQQKRLT